MSIRRQAPRIIYLIKRAVAFVTLVVLAFFLLAILVNVVGCLMIGPWGAALEGVDQEELPAYVPYLESALKVLLVLGPLLIAWKWSKKIVPPPSTTPSAADDETSDP